jgi:nitroreductase
MTKLAESREDWLAMMERRRSVSAMGLTEPSPSADELERLLGIAARVPDHAILEPWRFIVIEGQARMEAGTLLGEAYRAGNPGMEAAKREKFAGIMSRLFSYAPVAVIVVSRPKPDTMIPLWEQELSAGAACMNLLHGAHAHGFGAIWVTGWAATEPAAVRILGIGEGEKVAGIIHIGTPREVPPDRPRPDLAARVSRWTAPA